ncbi:1-phosphofructokinase/tagatose 6-phosphate kinase [Saccharicrinis carchari]|uniref:1-phosphofructokinase/tagatose 6-phosphate kinase n=1 Tax=Saccharicrinis carchari TaxID=1168039 RepID=A0A521DZ22_SACCC|nr:1-phosphofructokinase family hexose kinase [Saccharicrinis carchari]SMO76963.1 1-phosphofructokinase/tagatose 6-phosphate kinase [Saccharicrinis carchari]
MVLTVTLNPAIDKILIVDSFEVHKLHRLSKGEMSMVSAGGKGVNIANTLAKMGDEVIASGFAGGHAGHMLCDAIRKEGITTNFIFTQGSTRTNISILDRENETLTEINDFGQEIPQEDITFFMENYERLLARVKLIAIAGSLPLGVLPEIYIQMVDLARKQGKKVMVHTSPKYLPVLMEAQPFLINPDMRSDHFILGKNVDGVDQFISTGREILKKCPNTEYIIFTHRLENVVVVSQSKAFVLRPRNMSIVNMLGYADAYLAGFIHAYINREKEEEVLRYASAAGLTDVEDIYKEISAIDKIGANLSRIDIEVVNF